MATILQPTEENLLQMSKFLLSGGLVGIPTETVYGLAANALDPEASKKIFEVKNRPSNDPLICHVASQEEVDQICFPTDLARKLCDAFWPGPLTVILRKKSVVPEIVTAGLDSVAVRCSSHPVMRNLTQLCEFPIAAPSANPFAYISPTRAEHVEASLGNKIEYIIDGGPCEFGLESTIIDAREESIPRILRYGALSPEEIEDELGMEAQRPAKTASDNIPQIAPGSLPKHYSPNCKLEVVSKILDLEKIATENEDTAYLLLQKPRFETGRNVFWLSESGKLQDIAAHLFDVLRKMDTMGFSRIVAEEAKELGLGVAINDRLRRAAQD